MPHKDPQPTTTNTPLFPFVQWTSSQWSSFATSWSLLISGLVLIAAAVILPLRADLEYTLHQRDRALIIEQDHHARNASFTNMITALDQGNHDTLALLAQSNLGLIDADRAAILTSTQNQDPLIFELLEPQPTPEPTFSPRYSKLQSLVLTPRPRLWVTALGIFLIFLALLPPSKKPTPSTPNPELHPT